METWGIFWICFFGAMVLIRLFKYAYLATRKKTILSPEQEKEAQDFIKECVSEFAKNIKVEKVVAETKKKKKQD